MRILQPLLFVAVVVVGGQHADAQIGDRVWLDEDRDGVQDAGEPSVPGVIVRLHRASFQDEPIQLFGETVTGANGRYRFDVTPFHRYMLEFVLPPGFAATTPRVGTRGLDSDLLPSGFTRGFYSFSGELSWDAGIVTAGSEVGDRVWWDENSNGQQDSGEPNAADVTVTLWQDVDQDGTADFAVATTVTGANGRYLFTDVPAGDFAVEFMGPPFSQFSTPLAASFGVDSNVVPGMGRTDVFSVGEDEKVKHIDAGLVPGGARLGDLLWDDLNENGRQDTGEPGLGFQSVRLWEDVDGDKIPDVFLQETETNFKGKYRFNQLPSDKSYIVEFTPRARYGFTRPLLAGASEVDSDAGVVSGRTRPVTVQAGQMTDNVDAGMFESAASPSLIFGKVWDDSFKQPGQGIELCGDGLFDESNDPTLSNVVVDLYADDFRKGQFSFVQSVTSNATGGFYLRAPSDTSIQFRVEPPLGKALTYANVANQDPSNAIYPNIVNPDTGSSNPLMGVSRVDIGLIDEPSKIGDRVWWDTDGDGLQGSGEATFDPANDGDVELALVRDQDGDGVPETPVMTTGLKSNGRYSFGAVSPGLYSILANVQASGAIGLSPANAGGDGVDSDFQQTSGGVILQGETAAFSILRGQIDNKYDLGLQVAD